MLKKQQGFNLIELMIVVAIVGIIAGIAYPSYQDSVRKSNRQIGKTALLEILGRQEQYFVNTKSYTTDLSNLGYSANGFNIDQEGQEATSGIYRIQLATGATTTSFTVEAVPQGGQANDTGCGTLRVADSGARSVSGADTDCW
ncbi:MAG: type IV pilin protein [Agarilytica sp.]